MKHKKLAITLLIIGGILLTAVIGFLIYVSIYYHADDTAQAALQSDAQVTVTEENGRLVFAPAKPTAGLIFYPGGKVDYHAYAPLLHELARQNMLCIAVEMPFNLAVFRPNAADGIQEAYPSVQRWYIGGHSLGGSMAALYANGHRQQLEGLILLAAYSTADLSDSDLCVLSVYGSEDGVLNRDKYTDNLSHLPGDYRAYIIPGGCHAYFGSYGAQKGDGEPTITPQEQVQQTVRFIMDNLREAPAPSSKTTALTDGVTVSKNNAHRSNAA